jgi:hypothetical protein
MAGYYDEGTGNWIDTSSGEEVDTGDSSGGNLDNTSGTTELNYSGVVNSDGTVTYTDPDGSSYTVGSDGKYTGGAGSSAWTYDPATGQSTFNNPAAGQGLQAFLNSLARKVGLSSGKDLAGIAGGLYGLYKSRQKPEKTGYQGGIPKYEAVREKVANTYDPERRPGSGNQKYFTDTKFVAPEGAEAARTTAKEEAAGLEALNKANPARQTRPVLQAGAEKKEVEKKEEVKLASSVIDKLPVPKYASGGIADMAKGRYLAGATDGMADKIPARIGGKQEARLSHGEFVVPADVVGHLGNGNSEAGAQRLYAMMDKIRKARTGTTKQGKQINPDKFLA